MNSLVPWKKRRDVFNNSDIVSGMGDSVESFDDVERPCLTGSSKQVKFIAKDDTNAEVVRILNSNWIKG